MVIGRKGLASIVLLVMLAAPRVAFSQERTPPKPEAPVAAPASTPAPGTHTPVDAEAAPQAEQPAALPANASQAAPARTKKAVYTGPNNVVELAPTPVLDEEGKQRLDPDGKPMFNQAVKQQRDKHGHPSFDSRGQPVMQTAKNLGYDESGKRIAISKQKPAKKTSVAISHGTLTVDGMIGKAALNYDIADLKYIYLYAPWAGMVVVSNASFPGATAQADAFNDKTLTVTVGEHTFQLYSDKSMLGRKPETAFVLVDRNFELPTRNPVMGYGATLKAPYVWPGAKLAMATRSAPPIPVNLRPTLLLPPCPAGQMRMPGPPVLPGETRDDPCVSMDVASRAAPPATTPAPTPAPSATAAAQPETPSAAPAPPPI